MTTKEMNAAGNTQKGNSWGNSEDSLIRLGMYFKGGLGIQRVPVQRGTIGHRVARERRVDTSGYLSTP